MTNEFMSDKRPQKGGWAPGSYYGACHVCGEQFTGDKRAVTCADCAYKDSKLPETLTNSLGVLNFLESPDLVSKYSNIYRAKRSDEFGLTDTGAFITGLTLVVVAKGNDYDSLCEHISNFGAEFVCHLPEGGLIDGRYYEAYEVCTSTDWETGYCDDTELYIRQVV